MGLFRSRRSRLVGCWARRVVGRCRGTGPRDVSRRAAAFFRCPRGEPASGGSFPGRRPRPGLWPVGFFRSRPGSVGEVLAAARCASGGVVSRHRPARRKPSRGGVSTRPWGRGPPRCAVALLCGPWGCACPGGASLGIGPGVGAAWRRSAEGAGGRTETERGSCAGGLWGLPGGLTPRPPSRLVRCRPGPRPAKRSGRARVCGGGDGGNAVTPATHASPRDAPRAGVSSG